MNTSSQMTWNRDIEAETEAERRTNLMGCPWAEDNHFSTDSTNRSSVSGSSVIFRHVRTGRYCSLFHLVLSQLAGA